MVSKIPERLTWVIARVPGEKPRAICVECSHPDRVESFKRRYCPEHCTEVVQPWGIRWDGTPMGAHERRVARNNIYRALARAAAPPPPDLFPAWETQALTIITFAGYTHGIPFAHMLNPPHRGMMVSRARGYAAHLLKNNLGLSMPQIASVMNWSNHSCVQYWLAQPFEVVRQPYVPQKELVQWQPDDRPTSSSRERNSRSGCVPEVLRSRRSENGLASLTRASSTTRKKG